ncbi:ribose ABC transporter permease [Halobacteriales archaeon SW_6_65_46]|nr:MAG: ribose ABC transporter permease [Halobacteriales archaeon SW_6_65_46]
MTLRDRIERGLARLVAASTAERFAISLAALFASILVGTVLILAAGRITGCSTATFVLTHPTPFGLSRLFDLGFCYNPVTVYDRLFLGALGDPLSPGWDPFGRQMALTLRETTVLLFAGLGVAVAFRAGIFNIGAQGQLVVGSLASVLAVLQVAPLVGGVLGTAVSLSVGLAAGALAGGLYAAIPGVLKSYVDANEVITTIMLNFIATGVVGYLVLNHVKDPESFATQTRTIPDHANVPTILFEPTANFSVLALGVGVLLVGGVYYLLAHTAFGYDLRTSGLQPEAAEYGGVNSKRTIVASFSLSGALAGIGGAVYALMILGKFQTGVPSYGFDGITVSILAGNNPLGVGFAAFLFGVLKSGAGVVNFATDVPPQLVDTLRGLIILFVAMPEFFRLLGGRMKGVTRRVNRDESGGETDG